MFQIQKFALKAIAITLGIIVGGVVLICVGVAGGCAPNNGTEFSQRQLALATRTDVDSSQKDESQDNSIVLKIPEKNVVGPPLPPVNSNADDVAKLVDARANERVKVILAQAELKEKVIRAEEEKWRNAIYGVIGAAFLLIAFWLYLKQSPWDKKRKAVND